MWSKIGKRLVIGYNTYMLTDLSVGAIVMKEDRKRRSRGVK